MRRSSGTGLSEHGGLVTVSDEPAPRVRPGPGDRLKRELDHLDAVGGGEAQRLADARRTLHEAIRAITEERTLLLKQAEEKKAEIGRLQSKLDLVPDEETERTQRRCDRVAALSRVLGSERHMVDEMFADYGSYTAAVREWEASLVARPDLAESRDLLAYEAAEPGSIAVLDPVLRRIIEARLTAAREAIGLVPRPERPKQLAPVYECVTPGPEGGSVVVTVLPAARGALVEGHPQAVWVASIVAATCQALLDLTDADAPVVLDQAFDNAVVVGAVCGTHALDADLFGARLQELLAESTRFGIEVQAVEDIDLAGALAEIVRKEVIGR